MSVGLGILGNRNCVGSKRPNCGARAGVLQAVNDDPFAGSDLRAVDKDICDRFQQNVLGLLTVGPALAARPVPIRDLVRVLIVADRGFHHAHLAALSVFARLAGTVVFAMALGALSLRMLPQGSEGPLSGMLLSEFL